jgi:hypothetical protein
MASACSVSKVLIEDNNPDNNIVANKKIEIIG